MISKFLRSAFRNFNQSSKLEEIIEKSSRFCTCEMIEGDYFEFGVYRGSSFIKSYFTLKHQFQKRIKQSFGGEGELAAKQKRQKIWDEMRFFAFDSFEGLPELTKADRFTMDFEKGQHAYSEPDFVNRVIQNGVPENRIKTIKGFFDKTCTDQTIEKYNLKKASIIWIDADLYSSTNSVLTFIPPLLQSGTIIIFDDWFSFRGSPLHGVQKAFYDWQDEMSERFVFSQYQKDSWKRNSFIVTEI